MKIWPWFDLLQKRKCTKMHLIALLIYGAFIDKI